MIDPNTAFAWAGPVAMAGWIALVAALFVPGIRSVAWPAAQLVLPGLLSILYVVLLWAGRDGFAQGGFASLADVRALFGNDSALAAGWVHYLAFDLFVGAWISRDAAERRLPPILVLACLPLTFLFGPAGLLLYLALRLWLVRSAALESST